jgi:hypothetical protein
MPTCVLLLRAFGDEEGCQNVSAVFCGTLARTDSKTLDSAASAHTL